MRTQLHTAASPARSSRALAHILACRTCRWAAPGLLAAVAFADQPVRADVTEAWVHRYNNNVVSNSDDRASKIVRDAAGDIIVTAFTNDGTTGPDMLTIKFSGGDGSVIWQKRYSGPSNSDDQPSAVAVDGGGNVVVTGSSGYHNRSDYCTAKYAAKDGALL